MTDVGFALDVVLPAETSSLTPDLLVAVTQAAEQHGYARVFLPDHILPPAPYGGTYSGIYEPLMMLSHLAAVSSRIGLATSVVVLPLRDPYLLAKQAATLDRLSGGRLTLGVGVGWDSTEFTSLGIDFASRGARADDSLRLIRHLFGESGPYHGTHYRYEEGVFEPRPHRHIPILIGGMGRSALRRAAEFGDEWQGLTSDRAEFADRVAYLRSISDRRLRLSTRVSWTGGRAELLRAQKSVDALRDAGAERIAVWFGPPEGYRERLATFAAELG